MAGWYRARIGRVNADGASFISRRLGADVAARPIAEWAHEKGQLVDPSLWRADALGGRRSGLRLYDLRPAPLVAATP